MKYLQNKSLKFKVEVDVANDTYNIKQSETFINETQLISNGSFVLKNQLQNLDISFKGKNLDISTTLSLLPERYKHKIDDYESDGEFYVSGECHYKLGKPFDLKADFGIKQSSITHKKQNATLNNVNLFGTIEINEKRSVLKLKDISANLNNNNFKGDLELSHFEDPYLKLELSANTKLEELIAFYPIDTLQELSGNISLNAQLEGLISEIRSNAYNPNVIANGKVLISNLKVKFKQSEKQINIPSGEVELSNRNISVKHLKIIKGNSDITLEGESPNFLNYLFDLNTPFTVIANVTSNNIELADFLFGTSQSSQSKSIIISDKLDVNISVDIKHLTFSKFIADHVTGNILLKNQKIAGKDILLKVTDGELKLNAFADASGETIKVSGNADLTKLNIQKLFYQLNNFGQTAIQDHNLKGFVTANIDFSGVWNKELKANLSTINVASNILIEHGELIKFKPLESLAKYIDVNELKHIKFSTLQSSIDIKNKMITLPKTSIKSNAINLELWGKHTFDNGIEYHIQLLLNELLAKKQKANKTLDDELSLVENDPENRRSVFILMTGTIDNPIIKYDRKGAKEKIKQDIQQEKQNLKQLLKEEFGFFKKDTIKVKEIQKSNQKFLIQIGDEKPTSTKPLQPKQKDEEDDF